MRAADSNTASHRAKVEPGSDGYAERVSKPMMDAIDSMPRDYRALVHDYGYVDVYRAWRRGWSAERIRASVRDGRFVLEG